DLEVSGHAPETNEFERPLLGGKIVVEARLPNAEHVGDVLGRRTMEAALREDASSGLDNLGGAPPRAWPQASCGQRHDRHDVSTSSWDGSGVVLCHAGELNSTYLPVDL